MMGLESKNYIFSCFFYHICTLSWVVRIFKIALLTALWSNQKDIQDTDTVMEQGTYTVTRKNDNCRANKSFTLKQEYSPERNVNKSNFHFSQD